jgi:hypothetical protein
MVTVQLSKDEKLILPESLGRSLGLREGGASAGTGSGADVCD